MPERPLNPHLFLGSALEHKAILPAVHKLFDQHELNLWGRTLSMVLGNLLEANAIERLLRAERAEDIKVLVFYSRDRNFYAVGRATGCGRDGGGKHRYGLEHWAREKVCAVMDRLAEHGMIEHRLGHHPLDAETKGRRSTARASMMLEDIIVEATSLGAECASRYFAYRERGGEVIILKDRLKRFQNYMDDSDTETMRANLELINAVNEKHIFSLAPSLIPQKRGEGLGRASGPFISNTLLHDLGRCHAAASDEDHLLCSLNPLGLDTRMVRIFNDSSFDLGGRFYGSQIQGLSGNLRRSIMLDGHPTVELDFSGMHLRIIYALEEIQFDDDPYIVMDRPELRPFTKLLCLICINSKSRHSAKRAFENRLRERGETLPADVSTDDLIACFERVHKPILGHFYSNRGLIAQNIDSQIAERVMLEFAKLEKPIACIHDSFSVKLEDKEMLRRIMIVSYRSVMDGFAPVIKAA